jgi:hypothetical protein
MENKAVFPFYIKSSGKRKIIFIVYKMAQSEKSRGIVGYILAIIIANSINIILTNTTTLTIEQSTFLSMYIFGSIVVYTSDIIIAKDCFPIDGKLKCLDHFDIKNRFKWYIGSLVDKYFFRFLLTVIIDTIIGISVLKYAIKTLDDIEFLSKWKYRNHLIVFIIAILTYILYLSTLRFDWAYNETENLMLNILVIAWVSLAILISSTTTHVSSPVKWRNLY